jgi:DNA-binding NtrC family response regulator
VEPIFIVDDELAIAAALERLLSRAGYPVRVFHEAEPAVARVADEKPFLVLLDLQLPGISGMDALKLIREKSPDTDVVIISGYGTIDRAVEAMKLGAADFFAKPLQLPEVLARVGRIHETFKLRHEVNRLRNRQRDEFFAQAVQSSHPVMAKIYRAIERVSRFPNLVALVTGESGTGKEMLSRRLHYAGVYADGPFVAVNCAAIPENLIESELFGYEPGAFTGALAAGRDGKIVQAQHGTLFLDEIGDLSGQLQVKLLRFLQDREITRLGGHKSIKVACNIITATNRDPEARLTTGELREDLYYRINVIRLHVPPLRERPEDILTHAVVFLEHFRTVMGRRLNDFDKYAIEKLTSYSWPGNLRELRNVIERACLLSTGVRISAADLVIHSEETTFELGNDLAKPMGLDLATGIYARHVLDSVDGNKSEAARLLGISRNRLKRLLAAT